jgi:hypothetical protein
MKAVREMLRIPDGSMKEVNDFLLDPNNQLVNDLLKLIDKYGGVDGIKRKAEENGKLENLLSRLEEKKPEYAEDIRWLIQKRDEGAFITEKDYRRKVLGDQADSMEFKDEFAVTLEISACQYFNCFMTSARQAIDKQELMPGRFIRVRAMKEQEDDGDLLAITAAMKVLGASWCETLDTKGTDGSNVHLGGPDTITGYFGGVGQPNEHAIDWIDEFLYYHTNYGVKQVLNINPGTVFAAYMLYKLGVDIEFKISVFMGNDNPYAVFWTIMGAKLFSRDDGTTPLIGFNYSNSVNNDTILSSSEIRKALKFDRNIRFEHHILETWKSIVVQPYDRRAELLDIADKVPNIAAKHEGGETEIEMTREHPSDILDYFAKRADVEATEGLMKAMHQNYLDKHNAVNNTAKALTEKGLSFIAAPNLHHK